SKFDPDDLASGKQVKKKSSRSWKFWNSIRQNKKPSSPIPPPPTDTIRSAVEHATNTAKSNGTANSEDFVADVANWAAAGTTGNSFLSGDGNGGAEAGFLATGPNMHIKQKRSSHPINSAASDRSSSLSGTTLNIASSPPGSLAGGFGGRGVAYYGPSSGGVSDLSPLDSEITSDGGSTVVSGVRRGAGWDMLSDSNDSASMVGASSDVGWMIGSHGSVTGGAHSVISTSAPTGGRFRQWYSKYKRNSDQQPYQHQSSRFAETESTAGTDSSSDAGGSAPAVDGLIFIDDSNPNNQTVYSQVSKRKTLRRSVVPARRSWHQDHMYRPSISPPMTLDGLMDPNGLEMTRGPSNGSASSPRSSLSSDGYPMGVGIGRPIHFSQFPNPNNNMIYNNHHLQPHQNQNWDTASVRSVSTTADPSTTPTPPPLSMTPSQSPPSTVGTSVSTSSAGVNGGTSTIVMLPHQQNTLALVGGVLAQDKWYNIDEAEVDLEAAEASGLGRVEPKPESDDQGPPGAVTGAATTAASNSNARESEGAPKRRLRFVVDLEKLPTEEIKRQEVIYELIVTEREYIRDLKIIIELFLKEMREKKIVQPRGVNIIFSNVEQLLPVNQAQYLKIYTLYCGNQPEATAYLRQSKHNQALNMFLQHCFGRKECRGLDIGAFLLKPVQRICKYPLLIGQLLKNTPTYHIDHKNLVQAHETINKVVDVVNERRRFVENQQKMLATLAKLEFSRQQLVHEPARRFIYEGMLHKFSKSALLPSAVQRWAVLFSDSFILAKPPLIKGNRAQVSKIFATGRMVVNDAADDKHRFCFCIHVDNGKDYYFAVPTVAEKLAWINRITEATKDAAEQINRGATVALVNSENEMSMVGVPGLGLIKSPSGLVRSPSVDLERPSGGSQNGGVSGVNSMMGNAMPGRSSLSDLARPAFGKIKMPNDVSRLDGSAPGIPIKVLQRKVPPSPLRSSQSLFNLSRISGQKHESKHTLKHKSSKSTIKSSIVLRSRSTSPQLEGRGDEEDGDDEDEGDDAAQYRFHHLRPASAAGYIGSDRRRELDSEDIPPVPPLPRSAWSKQQSEGSPTSPNTVLSLGSSTSSSASTEISHSAHQAKSNGVEVVRGRTSPSRLGKGDTLGALHEKRSNEALRTSFDENSVPAAPVGSPKSQVDNGNSSPSTQPARSISPDSSLPYSTEKSSKRSTSPQERLLPRRGSKSSSTATGPDDLDTSSSVSSTSESEAGTILGSAAEDQFARVLLKKVVESNNANRSARSSSRVRVGRPPRWKPLPTPPRDVVLPDHLGIKSDKFVVGDFGRNVYEALKAQEDQRLPRRSRSLSPVRLRSGGLGEEQSSSLSEASFDTTPEPLPKMRSRSHSGSGLGGFAAMVAATLSSAAAYAFSPTKNASDDADATDGRTQPSLNEQNEENGAAAKNDAPSSPSPSVSSSKSSTTSQSSVHKTHHRRRSSITQSVAAAAAAHTGAMFASGLLRGFGNGSSAATMSPAPSSPKSTPSPAKPSSPSEEVPQKTPSRLPTSPATNATSPSSNNISSSYFVATHSDPTHGHARRGSGASALSISSFISAKSTFSSKSTAPSVASQVTVILAPSGKISDGPSPTPSSPTVETEGVSALDHRARTEEITAGRSEDLGSSSSDAVKNEVVIVSTTQKVSDDEAEEPTFRVQSKAESSLPTPPRSTSSTTSSKELSPISVTETSPEAVSLSPAVLRAPTPPSPVPLPPPSPMSSGLPPSLSLPSAPLSKEEVRPVLVISPSKSESFSATTPAKATEESAVKEKTTVSSSRLPTAGSLFKTMDAVAVAKKASTSTIIAVESKVAAKRDSTDSAETRLPIKREEKDESTKPSKPTSADLTGMNTPTQREGRSSVLDRVARFESMREMQSSLSNRPNNQTTSTRRIQRWSAEVVPVAEPKAKPKVEVSSTGAVQTMQARKTEENTTQLKKTEETIEAVKPEVSSLPPKQLESKPQKATPVPLKETPTRLRVIPALPKAVPKANGIANHSRPSSPLNESGPSTDGRGTAAVRDVKSTKQTEIKGAEARKVEIVEKPKDVAPATMKPAVPHKSEKPADQSQGPTVEIKSVLDLHQKEAQSAPPNLSKVGASGDSATKAVGEKVEHSSSSISQLKKPLQLSLSSSLPSLPVPKPSTVHRVLPTTSSTSVSVSSPPAAEKRKEEPPTGLPVSLSPNVNRVVPKMVTSTVNLSVNNSTTHNTSPPTDAHNQKSVPLSKPVDQSPTTGAIDSAASNSPHDSSTSAIPVPGGGVPHTKPNNTHSDMDSTPSKISSPFSALKSIHSFAASTSSFLASKLESAQSLLGHAEDLKAPTQETAKLPPQEDSKPPVHEDSESPTQEQAKESSAEKELPQRPSDTLALNSIERGADTSAVVDVTKDMESAPQVPPKDDVKPENFEEKPVESSKLKSIPTSSAAPVSAAPVLAAPVSPPSQGAKPVKTSTPENRVVSPAPPEESDNAVIARPRKPLKRPAFAVVAPSPTPPALPTPTTSIPVRGRSRSPSVGGIQTRHRSMSRVSDVSSSSGLKTEVAAGQRSRKPSTSQPKEVASEPNAVAPGRLNQERTITDESTSKTSVTPQKKQSPASHLPTQVHRVPVAKSTTTSSGLPTTTKVVKRRSDGSVSGSVAVNSQSSSSAAGSSRSAVNTSSATSTSTGTVRTRYVPSSTSSRTHPQADKKDQRKPISVSTSSKVSTSSTSSSVAARLPRTRSNEAITKTKRLSAGAPSAPKRSGIPKPSSSPPPPSRLTPPSPPASRPPSPPPKNDEPTKTRSKEPSPPPKMEARKSSKPPSPPPKTEVKTTSTTIRVNKSQVLEQAPKSHLARSAGSTHIPLPSTTTTKSLISKPTSSGAASRVQASNVRKIPTNGSGSSSSGSDAIAKVKSGRKTPVWK
ncbi:Myosin 10A, isoform D, partial [Quaeritorhiza haematococci]